MDFKKSLEGIIASLAGRITKLENRRSGPVSVGLAASRPVAPDTFGDTTIMFFATDTNTLSIWNPVSDTWKEEVLT